jgi:conjugal transfer mating pair stabilization protein TraG
MRDTAQASKQLSHSSSDQTSRSLAEDVSGSYEKGMSQRSEASKSFSQSESYSAQASFTRANSAAINRNASQEFVDWMAEQPADNSPGRLGHRGAGHIIANNPEQATAYAQKFMAEKGLVVSQGVGMSPSQLRNHYDQQSGHHIHSVSGSALDDVRSQGSDLSANTNRSSIRADVEAMQSDHQHAIASGSNELMGEGNSVKQQHTYEQNKGAIRRLGERGIGEVGQIVDDVKNIKLGESQQR